MRKTELVPTLKLGRQTSCRIKFGSCSHLHNDFKLLTSKQPQILSIYEIIIWPEKTGTGWCFGFWQICIFSFFSGKKIISFIRLWCVSFISIVKDEINKGSSKVCHSNCCFTGFCAAHCMYGPLILYTEAEMFLLKEWRKRSRRKWKSCFDKGREKYNLCLGPVV